MNGFKRGLEYIAEFLQWIYWAVTTQNDAATVELLHVAVQWFKELTNANIEARQYNVQGILVALAFGRDPFIVSRQMLQKVKETYPH